MTLNESAVEAAALEWFGDPPPLPLRSFGGQGWGDAVGHWVSCTAPRQRRRQPVGLRPPSATLLSPSALLASPALMPT